MTRTLHIFIAVAGVLFMHACSVFDDHLYGPNGEQNVRISFILALGSSDVNPLTKAEARDTIGYSYDNTIIFDDLQVVLYKTDNTFYTKVDIEDWVNVDKEGNTVTEDGVSNLYQLDGRAWIDEDYVRSDTTALKLMVFANYDEVIDCNTDLQSLTYDFDSSYIPMWGVNTVMVSSLIDDEESDTGVKDKPAVYMLRSMARVEIMLSKSLSDQGYALKQMTMNNLNSKGYLLPKDAVNKSATEKLKLSESLNPYDSHLLSHTVVGEGSSLVMYVPEYENAGSSLPATINVAMEYCDNGVMTTVVPSQAISFRKYDSGHAYGEIYDICRNHNYRFVITGL